MYLQAARFPGGGHDVHQRAGLAHHHLHPHRLDGRRRGLAHACGRNSARRTAGQSGPSARCTARRSGPSARRTAGLSRPQGPMHGTSERAQRPVHGRSVADYAMGRAWGGAWGGASIHTREIRQTPMFRFYYIAAERRLARHPVAAVGRAQGVAVGQAQGVAVGRAQGVAVGRAQGVAVGRTHFKLEAPPRASWGNYIPYR